MHIIKKLCRSVNKYYSYYINGKKISKKQYETTRYHLKNTLPNGQKNLAYFDQLPFDTLLKGENTEIVRNNNSIYVRIMSRVKKTAKCQVPKFLNKDEVLFIPLPKTFQKLKLREHDLLELSIITRKRFDLKTVPNKSEFYKVPIPKELRCKYSEDSNNLINNLSKILS